MTVTRTLVRTTYLELEAATAPRPPQRTKPDYELRQAIAVSPEFARFLYTTVGYRWNWTRRLGCTWAEWENYLRRDRLETWVAYVGGTPAGYFDLAGADADGVEIVYFGLLPGSIGIGLGGYLLCDGRGACAGTGPRPSLAAHLHHRPSPCPAQLPGARLPTVQGRGRIRRRALRRRAVARRARSTLIEAARPRRVEGVIEGLFLSGRAEPPDQPREGAA